MNLTLSIPDELKVKMSRFPEVNWCEVARQAIMEKVQVLEQMQQLLSRSTLTEQDAIKIGREIKRRMWKKSRLTSKRKTFHALVRRSRRYARVAGLTKRTLAKALRNVRHAGRG